jgi:hypothetical protein
MKWTLKHWWQLALVLVLVSAALTLLAMVLARPGLAAGRQEAADEQRAILLSEKLLGLEKETGALRQELGTAQGALLETRATLADEQKMNSALREDLNRAAGLLKQTPAPGSAP